MNDHANQPMDSMMRPPAKPVTRRRAILERAGMPPASALEQRAFWMYENRRRRSRERLLGEAAAVWLDRALAPGCRARARVTEVLHTMAPDLAEDAVVSAVRGDCVTIEVASAAIRYRFARAERERFLAALREAAPELKIRTVHVRLAAIPMNQTAV
ncbi:MAG: hypothetical protein V3T70_00395 [Phycisphaerae bacterium]